MNPRDKELPGAPFQLLVILLVPVMFLVPFINKAFHMDDTLFIWTAQHIKTHPLDFYGFSANWYGFEMPMFEINQNPPLVSYFIALVASLCGWSELPLHVAFLIPAVGLCAGTYYLARLLCPQPLVAGLITVVSPVFLVSSTNVMCDTLMVAFYVWAAVLWIQGLARNRSVYLLCSGILISLAALTKYFGITMAVLLLIYSLVKERRIGQWLIYLAIPVLVILCYQWLTNALYGQGLFSSAATYALKRALPSGSEILSKTLSGLSFAGGSLLGVLFFMPFLWSRRMLSIWALFFGLIGAGLLLLKSVGALQLIDADSIRWPIILQLALFIVAGMHIVVCAADDLWHNRDSQAALLFFWVWGVFVFVIYCNWTINARTFFPMLPAGAILVVRRLYQRNTLFTRHSSAWAIVPLIASALITLSITWADYTLANCQRAVASLIHEKFNGYPHTIWFQGHWGFQYYLESLGAQAFDFKKPAVSQGDIMVIPINNTNIKWLPKEKSHQVGKLECMPYSWVSTVQLSLGAGFYRDATGPLPFVFGATAPELYFIYLAGVFNNPAEEIKQFGKQLKAGHF
jgi:4-amino-4-deoxy-L-arabinose transferase-like glycosyltransferase